MPDDKFIRDLLLTLSHDIRGNLGGADALNNILNSADISSLDERTKKRLGLIHDEYLFVNSRLKALSKFAQLFDHSEVLEDCCLESIAQTCAAKANNGDLINQQAPSNNVSIGSLPRVEGFKRFWLAYFEELFTNSILHAQAPNNSLVSRLRYVPPKNGGRKWQLIYEDNGVSLSKKDIDYLSKPFKTLKRVPLHSSNTGLGIAMLSRIVELHGGTLDVKSGENLAFTGLCITANLPVTTLKTKSSL